jgi:hypothetical protein
LEKDVPLPTFLTTFLTVIDEDLGCDARRVERPTASIRLRARKLGLSLPGVREVRKKLALSPRGRHDIAPYPDDHKPAAGAQENGP